jgi:DNA repair exonuclease SbcCD ATPase subunit
MISFKKLRFCNIGRFIKEQEIDFTQYNKLVRIKGSNNNTGGSSGAAKSTIFHAQDYLLGLNDISASNLQSRITKEPMWVEGEYDVDGVPLLIRRSKKEGLKLKYGDELIEGSVKIVEEKLERIIGIPNKLFKQMIHKKQKEGGFFLNLTAKESYNFLINILGLEQYEKKTLSIEEDIKKISKILEETNNQKDIVKKLIEEVKNFQKIEIEPTIDVDIDQLKQDELQIQLFKTEIKDIQDEMETRCNKILIEEMPYKTVYDDSENPLIATNKEKLSQIKAKSETLLLSNIQKTNEIKKKIDKVNAELSKISYYKEDIKRLAIEMKDIIAQKDIILSNTCPTCSQDWLDSSSQDKVQEIEAQILSKKEDILGKKEHIDKEEILNKAIKQLNNNLVQLDNNEEIKALNQEANDIQHLIIRLQAEEKNAKQEIENKYLKEKELVSSKISQIKEDLGEKILLKQKELEFLNENFVKNTESLKNYKQNIENYNKKMLNYNTTIDSKEKELKELDVKIQETTKKISIAEEAKRLIKSYTLYIFQDTLDSIGNCAADMLSNIPNMSNVSIYFEGCKENKNGKIRDEVNPVINMDGINDINIKTLSGGERTAIDLAVDLAVIDMIESLVGKGANFFILDEPFTGLEDVNIAQCLELLIQLDTNKKIILVDHNPIVQEMVEDFIHVERNGEESVIV